MGSSILVAAWICVVLWPLLLGWALWRGLKRGRGPGALGWTLVVVVTVLWGLGIRAFLWEPETLEVRRVEVVSRTWTGPPLRIGVISDIHMGAPHMSVGRLNSIVQRMNSERPDIVVLLGDFAGRHEPAAQRSSAERSEVLSAMPPLAKLEAPLGVWAVLGNHDWWYDGIAIERELEARKIQVLENERVLIPREGGPFWLAGLADYESQRKKPSYMETLADLSTSEPVLAIAHWPDVFAAAPDRVALTLAGHSHCGQVNLPFLGRMIHASHGSERWQCGLYEERGRKLYVTGGVGVSILPVRFLQPPEIAVVTLNGQ
ncbi:MAG TPA: metallophosphoesterase [Hyphomonadaceae bacterium]|nr:metallophosphoesterase [Hyphomonadaceae bacterium]